ncbi:PPOX class probable F420-dependent enzyme [Actinoalloteichus hoggarensis]|uniref:Putative pyridoxine/pyridoxamine 5'-phosphate oxidase n=1 Tax=Actinoalloteichus hoggarensis TaxID=1470176 RepID=A0A221W9W9_9PSEU|nr:PPOX class F420-dependent oxidoreductase [Actinoalloteichus hoggarensis]ASO22792.1 Putative pyridoxine/pyridoxamine 5'-phosphate oxidase [Actinoalloteichus hoggarensis]MBB5924066.1 PPOX class probable F420-dependent enzyme [Actinoalloteichus hoggarensis]
MPRKIATADVVELPRLLEFLRARSQGLLITSRADGRPQASPVTYGVDEAGRIVVSTYPQRAKVRNLRRANDASLVALSSDFDGPWVQVDGTAEVIDVPDSVEPLVDYFRAVAGEHPDWAEYRQAMVEQNKSLVRLTPRRWGPIATGGFPPELAD